MIKPSENNELLELLGQFGCSRLEADIYLILLQAGPSTIQEIAKEARQNRVTVHSAVGRLIEKGFLFETRKAKRRTIVAESASVLRRIIQRNENELNLLKSQLGTAEELLSQVVRQAEGAPSVKFYEGIDGFKRMLEETLEAEGEVLVFSYVDRLAKVVGPEYLENYFKRRAEKGIRSRLLFPPCDFADRVMKKKEEYNIEVKTLSPELVWQSGIFSWNDIVAILSYTERRFTCTIIENKDVADFYRRIIFEMCWQQAQSLG